MITVSRCSFCLNYEPIVFRDWASAQGDSSSVSFSMCWKCALSFKINLPDVKESISALFPKMIVCSTCQDKFIPQKQGHNVCRTCFLKTRPQQEKQIVVWRFG